MCSASPGGNTISVVKSIKQLLPQLEASLPKGIEVTTLTDLTTPIQASVDDVEFELMLTVGLVVMVIFPVPAEFLRDDYSERGCSAVVDRYVLRRCTCWDTSLDNLSLMALTISTGFVVDDAIVMVREYLALSGRG